jgi:hypothetical protein
VLHTGRLRDRFGTFRWVHVDGQHSHDAVMSDLYLATDAVSQNGVVVVDDFFNIGSACVTNAVFDFLGRERHRARMFLCGYNKAYLATPQFLGLYLGACGEELIEYLDAVSIPTTLAENAFSTELDYRSLLARTGDIRYRGIGFMKRDFTER